MENRGMGPEEEWESILTVLRSWPLYGILITLDTVSPRRKSPFSLRSLCSTPEALMLSVDSVWQCASFLGTVSWTKLRHRMPDNDHLSSRLGVGRRFPHILLCIDNGNDGVICWMFPEGLGMPCFRLESCAWNSRLLESAGSPGARCPGFRYQANKRLVLLPLLLRVHPPCNSKLQWILDPRRSFIWLWQHGNHTKAKTRLQWSMT